MDSVADNFTPVQDTITGVDDLSATQQQPVPSVTTPGNAGGDPIGANETSSRDAEGVEQTENSKGAATMAQHNDGQRG
ncbi:hypothetical protein N0V88_003681 [Collariella sp. IMI 366227]|nr:hypothetical protein N0V88_003681 [Collariella sp. IMI 366227]